MERIFNPTALIVLLVFAAAGFLIRLVFGALRGEEGRAFIPAIETAALTYIGGFLARLFISLVLGSADDSAAISLAAGWGFAFPIGVIDTVIFLVAGHPVLTAPDVFLWIALAVGGFAAMMSGIWRSYDWNRSGVPAFILDSTWGLSGTFDACLLHLINFAWAGHADNSGDRRLNNHRYRKGFALNASFAFTQGAVMSNLNEDSSNDLWDHENLHVWQNRLFGPLFTLTYVGWMVLLFIPSLIVAAVTRSSLGSTIMALCYYNNPWEVWAYKRGGFRRPFMAWSDPVVIVASLIFFAAVLALLVYVLAEIY